MNYQPNNLNTFKILFIIKGVFSILLAFFALAYGLFGMAIFSEISKQEPNIPFNFGSIFMIVGLIGFTFALTLGILDFLAARSLDKRTNYNLIFVTSILSALTGILGILLCIFTLIEISKPHVKALFNKSTEKEDPLYA